MRRTLDFFLPDRLRPPRWGEFRGRWMLLLIGSAVWCAGLFLTRALGDSAPASLLDAAWSLLFLLLGVCAYGPKRVRDHLAATEWGPLIYHVILVVVLLVLMDKLKVLGTDPAGGTGDAGSGAESLPPKGLMAARILAVGFLGPLAEEFAFRFVLFRVLRTRLGFAVSALLTSAAFGLVHAGEGLPMALSASLAGLLFCWTLERTRSLATPVAAHVLFNLLGV
ncbi:MAG: lysostaphin resistance A-like protein [Planctomycetota bacterium]